MAKNLQTPLTPDMARTFSAGDQVLISGTIYTARDAAHKRLFQLIQDDLPLPMALENQIIYYVGPCPAKPGQVIGSAGPTTSGRMDAYTPALLDKGLRGMIGKGSRNEAVVQAMARNTAVYFGAIGGAGALLAESVKKAEVIAFPELGAEAIYRLEVKDFPVTVIIDHKGNNLYQTGKAQYRRAPEKDQ